MRAEPFLQPQREMRNSIPQRREAPVSAETSNSLSQMEAGPAPPRAFVVGHFLTGPRNIPKALCRGGALPRDRRQHGKDMSDPAAWTPQDILPQDADPSASPACDTANGPCFSMICFADETKFSPGLQIHLTGCGPAGLGTNGLAANRQGCAQTDARRDGSSLSALLALPVLRSRACIPSITTQPCSHTSQRWMVPPAGVLSPAQPRPSPCAPQCHRRSKTHLRLHASPTQTAFSLSSQISACPSKGLFALSITLSHHYSMNCPPSSSCWATAMTCPDFTPPWGSQQTGRPPCTHHPPKPPCQSTAPTVWVGGAGASVPSWWTPRWTHAPPKDLSPQTHRHRHLEPVSHSETMSGKGVEERRQGAKTEATRHAHLVPPSFPHTLVLNASAATQRAHRGEQGTANFGHHEKYPAKQWSSCQAPCRTEDPPGCRASYGS